MAKYLLQASYTQEGVQGLLREGGTSRRATVEQLIRGMGGTLEAFYYAFGMPTFSSSPTCQIMRVRVLLL